MTHKLLHFTPTTVGIQNSKSEFLNSQINVCAGKRHYCPGKEISFALREKAQRRKQCFPLGRSQGIYQENCRAIVLHGSPCLVTNN